MTVTKIVSILKDLPEIIAEFKELIEKLKELIGDDEETAAE